MSAQRRTATKRRSTAQRPTPPAAKVAPAAEPVIDGAGNTIVEQPALRRSSINKPVSAEERARTRAEAKAAARQNAEKAASPGGVVGRVIKTDRASGLQKFIRETVAEIKKVNWPDQETTRNLTIVVIGVSLVLGLLLGGIDYVLFKVFEAL